MSQSQVNPQYSEIEENIKGVEGRVEVFAKSIIDHLSSEDPLLVDALRKSTSWDLITEQILDHHEKLSAISYPVLRSACELGAPVRVIRKIIQANPKAASSVGQKDGKTLLHVACESIRSMQSLELIPTLIDVIGSHSLFIQDVDGQTPLHLALKSNNVQNEAKSIIIKDLIAKGSRACLMLQNHNGDSPLHVAIAVNQSGFAFNLEMIKLIIPIYPSAVSLKNSSGRTPFHILSSKRYKFSSDTTHVIDDILLLMGLISPSAMIVCDDKYGYTPLHCLCETQPTKDIINAMLFCERRASLSFSAASIQDRRGFTPLHLACMDRSPLEVIRCILNYCPASAAMYDNFGFTPIDRIWQCNTISAAYILRVTEFFEPIEPFLDSCAVDIWYLVVLLAQSAYSLRQLKTQGATYLNIPNGTSTSSVLHAIFGAGISIPSPLLHLAMMIHRSGVREVNGNGNYPLHEAAGNVIISPNYRHQESDLQSLDLQSLDISVDGNNESDDSFDFHDDLVLDDIDDISLSPPLSRSPIGMIIEAFPEAVKIRNKVGRFPIHLALSTGKTWNEGVQSLILTFPQCLEMKDPVTKLYPFMLAAVKTDPQVPYSSETCGVGLRRFFTEKELHLNDEVSLCHLNTIFELLLAKPDSVNFVQL